MKLTSYKVFATAMLAVAAPAFATNVVVPNGDFTNTNNDGTVGGGLLATSGSSLIGLGPWSGTYNAALGILAPPSLTIDDDPTNGKASIHGLIGGTDILGLNLTDTSGWFQESAGIAYMANTVYTLKADVDAGALLSVSALDNFGAGISLLNGTNKTASSTDPSGIVLLTLLGGTSYQVSLQFTTGATAPVGNIGVRLFDAPSGLVTAGLLTDVSFSHVSLDASPVGGAAAPEPGTFALIGAGLLGLARIRKTRRQ